MINPDIYWNEKSQSYLKLLANGSYTKYKCKEEERAFVTIG